MGDKPIKLTEIIAEGGRLQQRVNRIFRSYSDKCKHHIPSGSDHPECCSNNNNNVLRMVCGGQYTCCDIRDCPDVCCITDSDTCFPPSSRIVV